MNTDHLTDTDLAEFERIARAEQERARKIQQIAHDQTGSVRGESKRKAKRQQQKQARKRNR